MCMWSELSLLHRTKERKTQVCLTKPVFIPFSLKMVWSGMSPIGYNIIGKLCYIDRTIPHPRWVSKNNGLGQGFF